MMPRDEQAFTSKQEPPRQRKRDRLLMKATEAFRARVPVWFLETGVSLQDGFIIGSEEVAYAAVVSSYRLKSKEEIEELGWKLRRIDEKEFHRRFNATARKEESTTAFAPSKPRM